MIFWLKLVLHAVNQNLVGTGFMTADQKKKLLWGSKKNSNAEEVPLKIMFAIS